MNPQGTTTKQRQFILKTLIGASVTLVVALLYKENLSPMGLVAVFLVGVLMGFGCALLNASKVATTIGAGLSGLSYIWCIILAVFLTGNAKSLYDSAAYPLTSRDQVFVTTVGMALCIGLGLLSALAVEVVRRAIQTS